MQGQFKTSYAVWDVRTAIALSDRPAGRSGVRTRRKVELLTGRLPGEEGLDCYRQHAGFDRAAV
jgi:hypothetical protein